MALVWFCVTKVKSYIIMLHILNLYYSQEIVSNKMEEASGRGGRKKPSRGRGGWLTPVTTTATSHPSLDVDYAWIYVSVFKFSIKDYPPPCELTNMVFYTWKCFLPKEYKPFCELTKCVSSTLKNVFYPQNIHLWLKFCFLHLKILFTWRIYTSVRMFVKFMHWIITSVRVD